MPKANSGLASANVRSSIVKQFTAKAEYSHEYEDDGGEAEQFFRDNSNFDQLISSMNREERNAFRDWTRGWFMMGQQWSGFDSMRSSEQALTRIYDKYLDQATLRSGVQVVRLGSAKLLGLGDKATSLAQLQALEGRVLPAAGSMSWGAASQGLTIGGDKNVEFVLSIPGGTKGAGMWVGDSRINGWGDAQREFMTNRDIVLSVGKSTFDRSRGVYVVELKYTGRGKHDYGRSGY